MPHLSRSRPAGVVVRGANVVAFGLSACLVVVLIARASGTPSAGAASFTLSGSVQPTPVAPGASDTVRLVVTSSTSATILVDAEIYDSASHRLQQRAFDNQSFAAGQTRTYSFTWQVPQAAAAGSGWLKIGIFGPGWNGLLAWNDSAATLTITGSAAPTPSPTPSPSPTPAPRPTSAYAQAVLADQPSVYWRLDDTSSPARNAAGAGFNAAFQGGVTTGVAGALTNDADPAMTFDGTSGYLSSNDRLTIGSDFTIETWVRSSASTETAPVVSLDTSAAQQSRTIFLDRDHFEGRVDQSANWPNYTISSGSLDPTVWHHVVFTVSGWTTLSLYIDGVLAANGSVPGTAAFSASPVVAWSGAGWLSKFGGSLDEVALYPRALPSARVQAHFQAARPAQATAMSTCTRTLQAQVDAAAPGSTLTVPACIYRETVTIAKPLVLDGQGHAEIRGSDVWANWSASGGLWLAGPAPQLPVVQDPGRCAANTANRCLVPQQVFFDGRPLQWVSGTPASGQFTITSGGQVALADNPSGHVIEVTTRQQWVITAADGVTIQGFTMKHAGNDAQSGAISNDRHANWTLQHTTLSDAHGDVVSVDYGSGTQVLSNDIARGGDLGLHGDHPSNLLVQGNTLHDNSTDGFSGAWEAGSIKMGAASGVVVDTNEIVGTQVGPGVWCDVACSNIIYSNNRVHDNASSGLFFEISNGAKIVGNRLWNNNWSNVGWASAAIVVASSANAEVSGNTLAWNAGGIAVVSQNRADQTTAGVVGNSIHDNTIVMNTSGGWQNFALGFFQDWSGVMYDPGANNRGANNRYWYPQAENGSWRFGWSSSFSSLGAFDGTPGGQGGTYLSDAAATQALSAAGMPTSP